MGYATLEKVKDLLKVSIEETVWDAEIQLELSSADAIVDAVLASHGLTVSDEVPQLILEASNNYAAWLFRRKRDAEAAQLFFDGAETVLQKYLGSQSALIQKRRCKVASTNVNEEENFW